MVGDQVKVSGYLGSCPRYDSCSLWGSSVFLSGVARPGDDCVVTLLHGRSEINIKPPSAELIDKNISPVCPSLPGCCKCSKGSHKGEPTYLGPWIAVRPVRGERCCQDPNFLYVAQHHSPQSKTVKKPRIQAGLLDIAYASGLVRIL